MFSDLEWETQGCGPEHNYNPAYKQCLANVQKFRSIIVLGRKKGNEQDLRDDGREEESSGSKKIGRNIVHREAGKENSYGR